MASQFSKDGKYFAQLSADGKLRLWETDTSNFMQEFTPDFHLTSPCTCLHFIQTNSPVNKNGTPNKKVRRHSFNIATPYVALGTSSGLLFMYSVAKGDLDFSINSNTNQSISCITWYDGSSLYSAADQNILCWDLEKRTIKSKWKTGNEKITSILLLPMGHELLTASKNIKLWNIKSKEVLKTFTGHSSEVSILKYIKPCNSSDSYCISGSNSDRLLSCWNLNPELTNKNSVASFLMEDVAANVVLAIDSDGSTNMAAVTRSGHVHIFIHTLNGRCTKPLKAKTTIRIASDSGNKKSLVAPIAIINCKFKDDLSLLIGHGNSLYLTFENVPVNEHEKVQCLIRQSHGNETSLKETTASKVRTPITENNVHYLTPNTSANFSTSKRKLGNVLEAPMEKRLENLTLSKSDNDSKLPKGDNSVHLLIQGLQSKDKEILRTALLNKDENVIKKTVKRLPMTVIVPLVEELNTLIKGKTLMCHIGSIWLKYILNIHSGILLSNPELPAILAPALGSIENRLALQAPLNRLRGRLELLISQTTLAKSKEASDNEPLLIFNDNDSSDSDMEGMEIAHSESENEWVEDSSDGEENNKDNSNVEEISDEEMST